jgi:hypothetical protein
MMTGLAHAKWNNNLGYVMSVVSEISGVLTKSH